MTVAELIEVLTKFYPDLNVVILAPNRGPAEPVVGTCPYWNNAIAVAITELGRPHPNVTL